MVCVKYNHSMTTRAAKTTSIPAAAARKPARASSSPPSVSLSDRHSNLTRQVILEAGIELLKQHRSAVSLSVRAVALKAGIAERTVFRYFPTREALIAALAPEVHQQIGLPEAPAEVATLQEFLRALYTCFDQHSALTVAALDADLFPHMLSLVAASRGKAIETLLKTFAPEAQASLRQRVAYNIRHLLTASSWYYYTHQFALPLEDAISCAEHSIRLNLQSLKPISPKI